MWATSSDQTVVKIKNQLLSIRVKMASLLDVWLSNNFIGLISDNFGGLKNLVVLKRTDFVGFPRTIYFN